MIVVNLMTKKEGEIKRFLDTFFKENTKTDIDVMEWIYVYRTSNPAIKIINSILNLKNKYDISLWVQIGDEDLIPVKKKNHKIIIEKLNQLNLKCSV